MVYQSKNTLTYAEMEDDKITKKEVIKLEYPTPLKTWHLDVIKTKRGYEMITVAYKDWSVYHYMSLYYTSSLDGIHFDKPILIMEPSKNKKAWDGQGLYRSSFLYLNNMYFVFYSGHNNKIKGTSIAFGRDINNLYATNINFEKDSNASYKFRQIVKSKLCEKREIN